MKSFLTLAAARVAGAWPRAACLRQDLPDLGGRTIKAVTENAYYPLNFADPKTGEGIGWEYDAINEIAKRLNAKVEWNLVELGRDDPGGARAASSTSAWTASPSTTSARQQIDFSDPYMTVRAVHAGARRRRPHHRRQGRFAANTDLLVGAQAGTSNFYAAVYDVLDGDEANPRIKLFDTFGASVQALKSRRRRHGADGSGRAPPATSAPIPGAFKTVGEPLGSDAVRLHPHARLRSRRAGQRRPRRR